MQTDKNYRRLNLVRFIMILAEVLLTGFVCYWLLSQYQEQKRALQKDIAASWSASKQQMMDSILLKEYIHPIIDSNTKFDFRFEFNTDSIVSASTHFATSMVDCNVPPPILLPSGASKIIIKVNDSTHTSIKGSPILTKRDLVLQGVRLFVNEIADSSSLTDLASWEIKSDTSLLKKVFQSRVSNIDPLIKVNWWTIKTFNIPENNNESFIFSIPDGDSMVKAGVSGFQLHLVQQILPQILFALLLLLLTLIAFILSFRSLKVQVQLNRQRNDFIQNMTHELKTPVATVKVALEALKNFNRKDDPKVLDEYLDMASSETNRLEMLISRVLNMPANGNMYHINPSEIDLKNLVHEVIQLMKPILDKEEARIVLAEPDHPCQVEADVLHMKGVLINLIDNSLKYSQKPAYIEVHISCHLKDVRISVSDKGVGISPEYEKKVFEKFFRVPTGDVHNVKGYGLGLSYAKAIMEMHKGRIVYRAGDNGGSCFELVFPKIQS